MVKSTGMPVAGRDYPQDAVQLRAWFSRDEDCLDYLDWLRWPAGFVCPFCNSTNAGWEKRQRYRCRGCRRQVSVTAGTIFHRSRIPLTLWFEVAWLMTTGKSGVSAAHVHRILPIGSYQSAWTMLTKFRHVMTPSNSAPLSGRVEIDETFLGGPKPGVTGRGALGKSLVAGAIEVTDSGWGRARLAVLQDASAASLRDFVTSNVATGSTVVTDAWSSYPAALAAGYDHKRLNVSASGKPAHESLPAVHRLFALVKRFIEGTYHGSGRVEHLPQYLDEFVFRFNRRHSRHRGLLFFRLLQRSVAAQPVSYRELVKRSQHKREPSQGVTGPRKQPGSFETAPVYRPWRNSSGPDNTLGT